MFANASVERPALYFTVLGEPTLKMLRYQRQFSFFDPELAGSAIEFINLSAEVMERDLGEVLQRIVSEIERAKPGIVVVDSFRTIAGQHGTGATFDLDHFIQRLALHLTSWEVTSFLLGEYAEAEQRNRSEEHTSELQSQSNLVCRLLLEKKKTMPIHIYQKIITNKILKKTLI